MALSIDMDIVASGARDGTCIIHSLQSGKYTRSLSLNDSVDLVRISTSGIFPSLLLSLLRIENNQSINR